MSFVDKIKDDWPDPKKKCIAKRVTCSLNQYRLQEYGGTANRNISGSRGDTLQNNKKKHMRGVTNIGAIDDRIAKKEKKKQRKTQFNSS